MLGEKTSSEVGSLLAYNTASTTILHRFEHLIGRCGYTKIGHYVAYPVQYFTGSYSNQQMHIQRLKIINNKIPTRFSARAPRAWNLKYKVLKVAAQHYWYCH
jgi:hypothetical protein